MLQPFLCNAQLTERIFLYPRPSWRSFLYELLKQEEPVGVESGKDADAEGHGKPW